MRSDRGGCLHLRELLIRDRIRSQRWWREGKRISREQFWVDGSGGIFYSLRYGK
jgi:hypothetical protein